MEEQYNELKKDLSLTITTGDFAVMKGELEEAIEIYKTALEKAKALYEVSPSEKVLKTQEELEQTINELEEGLALEKEEVETAELSEKDFNYYQEFIHQAHNNLKNAYLSDVTDSPKNALKFYERVAHNANRATGILPTTKALKLLYYSANKVSMIDEQFEEIEKALIYLDLALRVINDLMLKEDNEENAHNLVTTQINSAVLKYQNGQKDEAKDLYEKAIAFSKDRAEKSGSYNDYREEAQVLLKTAFFYEQMRELEDAALYFKELESVLSEMKSVFGEEMGEDDLQMLSLVQDKLN